MRFPQFSVDNFDDIDLSTFQFEILAEFEAGLTVATEDSVKEITYHDGGVDLVAFGNQRREISSTLTLSYIPVTIYNHLLTYLMSNSGKYIDIVMDEGELVFGADINPFSSDSRFYHSNPFSCQITSVVPKDEVFDNCFEIELTLLLQRDEVNPIFETPPEEIHFLVEFNLAAFTVYADISEESWSLNYASYPIGSTIRVYQTNPADETTAKYFVRVSDWNLIQDITTQVKAQRKRSDGTDRLLLKDVSNLNVKLGVMALSTFKDFTYLNVDDAELNNVKDPDYDQAKPQYFKEGILASEGISFPDKSISMTEAWGVEQPNGFSIKLSNTYRSHIQLIEANLNIAECSVWVVLEGVAHKYCSGLVESITWDAVNYTIAIEPRSLLELENTIPTKLLSDVFPEAQTKDEGETHMITYGPWAFGKLQKVAGAGIPFPKKKLSDKIGTTFSSSIIPYSDPLKQVPGLSAKVTDFYIVIDIGTEDPLVNNTELYTYCGVSIAQADTENGVLVDDIYIKILTSPATSDTQSTGQGSLVDDVYIEKEVILKLLSVQTWGSNLDKYFSINSNYAWSRSCVFARVSTEGLDYAQDPIYTMKETSHLISITKEVRKYTTDWCQQYKYQRQEDNKPMVYSWNNDSETYALLDRDLFIVKDNGLENIILPKFDQNTTSVTTGAVIGKRFYGEWYWNSDFTKLLKNSNATTYCNPFPQGEVTLYNGNNYIGSTPWAITKIVDGKGKRLIPALDGTYRTQSAIFESSKINSPLISTNAVSFQTRLKQYRPTNFLNKINSLTIGTTNTVNQIFTLFGLTPTDGPSQAYEMSTNTPAEKARLVDYLIAFTQGCSSDDVSINDWCGVYLGANSSSESLAIQATFAKNAEDVLGYSNFFIPSKETSTTGGSYEKIGAYHRIGASFKLFGSTETRRWILDDESRNDVTIPSTLYGSDNTDGMNKSGKLLVAGRVLVNRAARRGEVSEYPAAIERVGNSSAYVKVPSVLPTNRSCDYPYIEYSKDIFDDTDYSTHEYLTMDWVSVCHEYSLTDEIKTSFKGQSEDASIYMSQFIKMQLGFESIDAFEEPGSNSAWDKPWEVGITPSIMTVRIILKHKDQKLNRIVSFTDLVFELNDTNTNFGNNGFMPLYNLTGSMGGNNKFSKTEAFNASGALDIDNEIRGFLGLEKYPVNVSLGHQGRNKVNAKMPKTPPVVFPVDELLIPKNFFNEDFDYFNDCTDIVIQFGAKEWHPTYPSEGFRKHKLDHLHIYYGSYDFGGQLSGDMGIRLSKAKVDLDSDNDTDLFVKIQYGRTNDTGDYGIVSTPQAQFNQLMQREDPIKPLSIDVDLAVNYPKPFNTRFQMTSSDSISEILGKTAKHSLSYLIESNETGRFLEYSSFYTNRNGGAVFGFNETNVLRDSIRAVKQRKSSEFISKIKLSFNYHSGKDKLDTDLIVTFNPKATHTDGNLGAFVASGIYAGKVDMNLNIDKALVNIMRIQQSYFKTRIVNEKEVTAEWFFDDKEDSNTEDSIGQLTTFFSELFYFHSQEAWDLTFTTKMEYVIYSPEITEKQFFESQNKLTLGDLVSYKSWFLTDTGVGDDYLNLEGLGFIRQISPDFYNGTVDISIFSPLPPSVLSSLEADPIWDGNVGSIDMDDYTLETKAHLFTYPFKDGLNVGHPEAINGSLVQEEHQFFDNTFADQMEN